MQNNNNADMRLALLPTGELERMLRAETEREIPDDDRVLQLLHILEKRKAGETPVLSPGKELAWKDYQAKVNARVRRSVMSWTGLARAASIVLVISLLMVSLSTQAQAESLWERIVSWTDKFFSIVVSNPWEPADLEYTFKTENEGLQQVYDAVVALGITEPVVPMWLPEGYELLECVVIETAQKKYVTATFANGDGFILVNVTVNNTDRANQYPRDESPKNEIELFGNKYYIANNEDNLTAIYTKDNIENCLTADCQEDTLIEILKSIYVWEGNS